MTPLVYGAVWALVGVGAIAAVHLTWNAVERAGKRAAERKRAELHSAE